jgi:hypothetical protein
MTDYILGKKIKKDALIKSGGGTGPMKPGNRQICHGANPDPNAVADERCSAIPLLSEEDFFVVLALKRIRVSY